MRLNAAFILESVHLWSVFFRFGPFVQRRTAGSCWRGPSSSWHLHPASCAAPPAPCAPSPPAGCTARSHRGETGIFEGFEAVGTHGESGLPLLLSLCSHSLLLRSLSTTFLLEVRPLLLNLTMFWWLSSVKRTKLWLHLFGVKGVKTQYLPAKWEKNKSAESSKHIWGDVLHAAQKDSHDSIDEGDELFFLLLPLDEVSFDQRLQLRQILLHALPVDVLSQTNTVS